MARKVKWTEIAWGDLVEVSDYIAKDSHCYAAGFVREVRDAQLVLCLIWLSEAELYLSLVILPSVSFS